MRNLLIILLVLGTGVALAQETCTLTSSGNSSTATWSCTGASTEPIDMVDNAGNFVIIPAGFSYTHTDNNKTWYASVLLQEETAPGNADGGVITFSSKLNLGDGSPGCSYTLIVETGASIIDDGGGADRLIICGTSVIGGPGAILPWEPGGFTGPFTVDEEGGTLPVELVFFDAKVYKTQVNLAWATAQELNFDYFSLERASDGVSFKEVAQINGAGNSTARIDYEYVDKFPLDGISYYRLTAIDFDGYTEVLKNAMVNVENSSNDYTVFPNPVEGEEFSLKTNFVPAAPLDLLIYNNVGRVEGQYKVTDWFNTFGINDLQPGSYLLKLATPSGVIVKRILIR